jgi:beta-phosphoglucomutase-like phosphatase (HAD superfamily)
MIKAVILDMDGLMADTESIHKLAFKHFLQRYGKPFGEEDFFRFVGVSVRKNIEVIKAELDLPGAIDDLLDEREEIYLDLIRNQPPEPAAGLKEVISTARDCGLLLAVASGSPLDQIAIVVENLLARLGFSDGSNGVFRTVVSATEADRPKPYPDVYRLALGRLGVKAEESLAFEDSASPARTYGGVIRRRW